MKDRSGLSHAWWAHRGAGKLAPENTLAAIRLGAQHGFAAVEFDAMLSADGMAVVHHDWVIGRTSTDPSGVIAPGTRVDALTMAQLATLDAGAWHSPVYQGEPIPSLQEVLNVCHAQGMAVNLELKCDSPDPDLQARLAQAALRDLATVPDLASTLIVSSFNLPTLYAAREQGYSGPLAILYDEPLPRCWVDDAMALDAQAIHLNQRHVEPSDVRRIHTTGRAVRTYTVNDADRAAVLFEMGVDGVFTDLMDLPVRVQIKGL